MISTLEASVLLSAKDKTGNAFASAAQNARTFSQRLDAAGRRIRNFGLGLTAAVTLPLLALVKSSLESFTAFEKEMTNVATLVDTNAESMADMGRQVLAIARRTPVGIADLTAALYDTRSAGIAAGDAMAVLEGSARLAVAGLGSVKEANDLVTSAINAFNLQGGEQARVYDTIFKTVKAGKTTISQLAQGFGGVAAMVANANIPFDEYLASVAALTTTGAPAAQVHTQMKAALAGLMRDSTGMKKVLKVFGVKDFKGLVKASGGMVPAFVRINKLLKGNDAALIKLLGSVEGYNAFLGLTGKQQKAFGATLGDMRDGANAVDGAFAKQNATLAASQARLKNAAESIRISLGRIMSPVVVKLADKFAKLADAFDALDPKTQAAIVKWGALAAILGPLAIVVGTTAIVMAKLAKATAAAAKAAKSFVLWTTGLNLAKAGKGLARFSWRMGLVGLAATAAAGVVWWAWYPVKGIFTGVSRAIGEEVLPALKGLKPVIDTLEPYWTKLKGWMSDALTPPGAETQKSWDEWAYTLTRNFIDTLKLNIAEFDAAGEMARQMFDPATYVAAAKATADQVAAVWNDPALWKTIDDNAAAAGNAISAGIGGAWREVIALTDRFKAFWQWLGTIKWPELRAPEWWGKLFGDKAGPAGAAAAAAGKFTMPPGIPIPPRPQAVIASTKGDMLAMPPQKVEIGDGEVTLRIRIDGPGIVASAGIRQPDHLKVRLGIDNAGRLIGGI